jgi:adenine-specific DNA-methyltransferase
LEKFKVILKNKRETLEKKLPWYSLHWSRDLNMLNNTKIVCPRRSKLNNFALENGKNFEQSDIMMIAIKDDYKKSLDYNYLLGILNSKLFFFWLSYRGKVKGNTLELYGKPLEELPIKLFDKELSEEVVKITKKLIEKFTYVEFDKLNQTIYNLYKLSKEEVGVIEGLYIKTKFQK